ncbi:MAG: hypothetical protein V4662_10915 [Verrucomicrobiota bacterium]
MTKSIALLPLLALALVSCSSGENDGRQYYANNMTPIAGKMGVTYRRVKTDNPPPASEAPAQPRTAESDGLLGVLTRDHSDEPAGLLDRNEQPDEPGAKYWMHARQSPDPIASKMGVRVTRMKK